MVTMRLILLVLAIVAAGASAVQWPANTRVNLLSVAVFLYLLSLVIPAS